jgi:hypothetical protein
MNQSIRPVYNHRPIGYIYLSLPLWNSLPLSSSVTSPTDIPSVPGPHHFSPSYQYLYLFAFLIHYVRLTKNILEAKTMGLSLTLFLMRKKPSDKRLKSPSSTTAVDIFDKDRYAVFITIQKPADPPRIIEINNPTPRRK